MNMRAGNLCCVAVVTSLALAGCAVGERPSWRRRWSILAVLGFCTEYLDVKRRLAGDFCR